MAFLMTAKVMGSLSELAASGIRLLHVNRDAARACGACSAAGRDDDRGVVALDDRGPGDWALLKRRAWDQARFDTRSAAGEGHQALPTRACERPGIEMEAAEIQSARGRANRREAQVYQFRRLAFGSVAECLAVEPFEGRMERRLVVAPGRHRDGELRGLAEVADIGCIAQLHRSFAIALDG